MGNHITCAGFVFLADVYIFTRLEILSYCGDRFFFRSMYYKTVISFGFCNIHNNQGYQPSASADNPYLDLDNYGYFKNLIQ